MAEQNRTEQNRTEQNRTEQNKDSAYSNSCQDIPICLGGFGELCNKTQYHNQNRVYSSFTVSVAIATAFHPWYLVKDEKDFDIRSI